MATVLRLVGSGVEGSSREAKIGKEISPQAINVAADEYVPETGLALCEKRFISGGVYPTVSAEAEEVYQLSREEGYVPQGALLGGPTYSERRSNVRLLGYEQKLPEIEGNVAEASENLYAVSASSTQGGWGNRGDYQPSYPPSYHANNGMDLEGKREIFMSSFDAHTYIEQKNRVQNWRDWNPSDELRNEELVFHSDEKENFSKSVVFFRNSPLCSDSPVGAPRFESHSRYMTEKTMLHGTPPQEEDDESLLSSEEDKRQRDSVSAWFESYRVPSPAEIRGGDLRGGSQPGLDGGDMGIFLSGARDDGGISSIPKRKGGSEDVKLDSGKNTLDSESDNELDRFFDKNVFTNSDVKKVADKEGMVFMNTVPDKELLRKVRKSDPNEVQLSNYAQHAILPYMLRFPENSKGDGFQLAVQRLKGKYRKRWVSEFLILQLNFLFSSLFNTSPLVIKKCIVFSDVLEVASTTGNKFKVKYKAHNRHNELTVGCVIFRCGKEEEVAMCVKLISESMIKYRNTPIPVHNFVERDMATERMERLYAIMRCTGLDLITSRFCRIINTNATQLLQFGLHQLNRHRQLASLSKKTISLDLHKRENDIVVGVSLMAHIFFTVFQKHFARLKLSILQSYLTRSAHKTGVILADVMLNNEKQNAKQHILWRNFYLERATRSMFTRPLEVAFTKLKTFETKKEQMRSAVCLQLVLGRRWESFRANMKQNLIIWREQQRDFEANKNTLSKFISSKIAANARRALSVWRENNVLIGNCKRFGSEKLYGIFLSAVRTRLSASFYYIYIFNKGRTTRRLCDKLVLHNTKLAHLRQDSLAINKGIFLVAKVMSTNQQHAQSLMLKLLRNHNYHTKLIHKSVLNFSTTYNTLQRIHCLAPALTKLKNHSFIYFDRKRNAFKVLHICCSKLQSKLISTAFRYIALAKNDTVKKYINIGKRSIFQTGISTIATLLQRNITNQKSFALIALSSSSHAKHMLQNLVRLTLMEKLVSLAERTRWLRSLDGFLHFRAQLTRVPPARARGAQTSRGKARVLLRGKAREVQIPRAIEEIERGIRDITLDKSSCFSQARDYDVPNYAEEKSRFLEGGNVCVRGDCRKEMCEDICLGGDNVGKFVVGKDFGDVSEGEVVGDVLERNILEGDIVEIGLNKMVSILEKLVGTYKLLGFQELLLFFLTSKYRTVFEKSFGGNDMGDGGNLEYMDEKGESGRYYCVDGREEALCTTYISEEEGLKTGFTLGTTNYYESIYSKLTASRARVARAIQADSTCSPSGDLNDRGEPSSNSYWNEAAPPLEDLYSNIDRWNDRAKGEYSPPQRRKENPFFHISPHESHRLVPQATHSSLHTPRQTLNLPPKNPMNPSKKSPHNHKNTPQNTQKNRKIFHQPETVYPQEIGYCELLSSPVRPAPPHIFSPIARRRDSDSATERTAFESHCGRLGRPINVGPSIIQQFNERNIPAMFRKAPHNPSQFPSCRDGGEYVGSEDGGYIWNTGEYRGSGNVGNDANSDNSIMRIKSEEYKNIQNNRLNQNTQRNIEYPTNENNLYPTNEENEYGIPSYNEYGTQTPSICAGSTSFGDPNLLGIVQNPLAHRIFSPPTSPWKNTTIYYPQNH